MPPPAGARIGKDRRRPGQAARREKTGPSLAPMPKTPAYRTTPGCRLPLVKKPLLLRITAVADKQKNQKSDRACGRGIAYKRKDDATAQTKYLREGAGCAQ